MPEGWAAMVDREVPLVVALAPDRQQGILDDMRILIDEKYWEAGGRGFTLEDTMKVVVAANLAYMLRGHGLDQVSAARTIILYAGAYTQSQDRRGSDGVVHSGTDNLGEAWFNGPVVLSWASALEASRRPGRGQNVIFHEFAHVVDGIDGVRDGTPPLPDAATRARWHEVMTATFEVVQRNHAAGRGDVIRPYALVNPAEFFAVTTELFFDAPAPLQAHHPEVFDLFALAWGLP
jgi:Mlc titration factor MtfA (ptsG expression regulator)